MKDVEETRACVRACLKQEGKKGKRKALSVLLNLSFALSLSPVLFASSRISSAEERTRGEKAAREQRATVSRIFGIQILFSSSFFFTLADDTIAGRDKGIHERQ